MMSALIIRKNNRIKASHKNKHHFLEEFLANKRTKLYQCIWGMMLDSNIVLLKKGIFSIIRYIFPGEEDEAEEDDE